jgi:predicted transcriptional regulator
MARRKTLPPLVERPQSGWNALRLMVGISLRELERQTGIGRGTLSGIESGRINPSSVETALILKVLRPKHPGATTPELER